MKQNNLAKYLLYSLLPLCLLLPHFVLAHPAAQTGDPVADCAQGFDLFLNGQIEQAYPLLSSGFDNREKATFPTLDDEAVCALVLGVIQRNWSQYEAALTSYTVALELFQLNGNTQFEGLTLNNIGGVYRAQGQYETALTYYESALAIKQEIGDRTSEGTTLNNIGAVYRAQGQYETALTYYKSALAIMREVGDRVSEGSTLNNIGAVYHAQGQYETALTHFESALTIMREVGDRASEGSTLNNIGEVYRAQGQYETALTYYESTLAIMQEIGDLAGEGTTLNNIGGVYDAQGQYETALTYYESTLAISQEIGDRVSEGTTLNNIGAVYHAQGQYETALTYYESTLAISREIGDRASEGNTLNNIGEVYRPRGQYENALTYYESALAIMQEIGDLAGEGTTLNNIGGVYDAQGQYETALTYFEPALAIKQEVGDRAVEGTTLNGIGAVYHPRGQYETALTYYESALAISQEIGDRPGEGNTLSNIGTVYHAQGQYETALTYYESALAIRQEVGDRAGEGTTLNNIGVIYDNQGQYESALPFYMAAMEIAESIRATAGNEAGRADFIAQYTHLYQRTTSLYYQTGDLEQAFLTSEQGRARSFLDSLSTGQVVLDNEAQSALFAQESALYNQRWALQTQLIQAQSQSSPDLALVSQLETELATIEAEYQAIQDEIAAASDQLATLVPGRGNLLSLTEIQELLDDQTTLLSYYILAEDEGAVAFIIQRDRFEVVALPEATPENLDGAVADLLLWATVSDTHPQPLQELHQWLIAPLADNLTTPVVGIIPHQALHYLPWTALTDGQSYFGDRYLTFLLPSANSLPFIQENQAHPMGETALILGNPTLDAEFTLPPLLYAGQEATAVASILNTTAHTGAAATEALVWQEVSGAGVLHLAAHGVFDPINPLYSQIYLGRTEEELGAANGRLQVQEIFGLDLQANDLVVLSACQTQLGDLSAGDDLVGMTRAFLFAGSPTIVASLWPVEDEATAAFMTTFYENWNSGMSKGEALQATQAEIRANPQWQSPYHWAGFVLNGSLGEVSDLPSIIAPVSTPTKNVASDTPNKSENTNFIVWGGIILFCLCGLVLGGVGIFAFVLPSNSRK